MYIYCVCVHNVYVCMYILWCFYHGRIVGIGSTPAIPTATLLVRSWWKAAWSQRPRQAFLVTSTGGSFFAAAAVAAAAAAAGWPGGYITRDIGVTNHIINNKGAKFG